MLKPLLTVRTHAYTVKFLSAPCSHFPLPTAYQVLLITSQLYTKQCLQVLIIPSANVTGGRKFASAVHSLIPRHSVKRVGTIVMVEDWLTVRTL